MLGYICAKGFTMIGQKKYYIDFKNKKVSEGIVISEQITQSGYDIYLLKTESGVEQVECILAFDKKEIADHAFELKMPIANQMEKINKETKRTLDDMRIRLIGEPKFKHLIGGK